MLVILTQSTEYDLGRRHGPAILDFGYEVLGAPVGISMDGSDRATWDLPWTACWRRPENHIVLYEGESILVSIAPGAREYGV